MPVERKRKVRYAVVGLGHIAQTAVLPAFAHAENSKLQAIVSDDPTKRKELAAKYNLEQAVGYDDYDDLLARGDIDAVYIALPNNMHRDYVVRAAKAGVHVLCEKPLGVDVEDCQAMIDACEEAGVRLMTAYRLHFEKANMKAVELVNSGKIGEARVFNSVFTMNVKEGDIRLKKELGGGTLYDIGIYCINAARYLFRAEPESVQAFSVRGKDPKFAEVDEATSAILHFPGERIATFSTSFGTGDAGHYQVLGTKGDIVLDPAYTYHEPLKHAVTINGKTSTKTFKVRDQFAAELIYFSNCVLRRRDPEPNGFEGLADVRIIQALYESSRTGERVQLPPFEKTSRPSMRQQISRPPVKEPELVHAASPSGD